MQKCLHCMLALCLGVREKTSSTDITGAANAGSLRTDLMFKFHSGNTCYQIIAQECGAHMRNSEIVSQSYHIYLYINRL